MKVREWMQLGVITCTPQTTAEEIAETMTLHDVSALVVTDAGGYVVGLVSRTDLVDAVFMQPCPRRGLAARQLMSSPVASVRAETPLVEAVRLIRARRIRRVVVTVAEGARERPIGMLSVTDLVGHLCKA